MRKLKAVAVLSVTLIAVLFFCSQMFTAMGQDQAPTARTLKITLKYTGAGTVDDTHKLYVFIFDTPDIQSGPMPVGMSSTGKNEGTVSIDVNVSPVYAAVVFDSTGTYDGVSGPPPAGSPAAMYMKEQPGVATPVKIEPGQTAEIELAFDDSFKIP